MDIEQRAVDLIAKVAPWGSPLPTAYLVGASTVLHLAWPVWVGVVAALVIEALGLATVATALELREYNKERRASDPRAPFVLAGALVGLYLAIALGLTVVLDTLPALARYAPALFPFLSLIGVTTIALRNDQRRRLQAVAQAADERRRLRAERRSERAGAAQAAKATAYVCAHCDARFAKPQSLSAHLRHCKIYAATKGRSPTNDAINHPH